MFESERKCETMKIISVLLSAISHLALVHIYALLNMFHVDHENERTMKIRNEKTASVFL